MKNLEEVYKYRELVINKYLPSIEEALVEIDDILYRNGCVYPRAISANIYLLIHLFLNLEMKGHSKEIEFSIFDLQFRNMHTYNVAELNIPSRSLINKFKMARDFFEGFKRTDKKFLVIQDGYEVKELRRNMKDYKFIVPSFYPSGEIIEDKVINVMFNFIDKHKGITRPMDLLAKVISAYIRDIVPKLNHLYFYYENQIRTIKPKALLYSIGANTVLEEMFVHIANKRRIPVFYFQHVADRIFSSNPLVKYFEDNESVNVYRIKKEEFGSMKLERAWENRKINKKKRDVLYCCSSPMETAKEYLLNVSMNMQKETFKEIINSVLDQGYNLDIKIHPVNENESYEYFKKLISGISNVRLLRGVKAEKILKNYKIIILDFLQSAMTDSVLISNAKVIIYLKDTTVLKWKHYIRKASLVGNEEELRYALTPESLDKIFLFNYDIIYGRTIESPKEKIIDYIRKTIE